MPGIFVCYRRDDTPSATGRLTDKLAARFGADDVCRDLEAIEAGADFRLVLRDALRAGACRAGHHRSFLVEAG